MTIERKCPECGTALADSAADGLCVRCLLEVGVQLGEKSGDGSSESIDFRDERDSIAGKERLPDQPIAFHQFGDYELLEEIARGGMGIVYRARQVSLDRIVAVKVLLAGPLAGKNFIQRFRTEAAAAASLQHPNIVAIHEVGFARGQHFFAMDYVAGLTLAQLAAEGPLPARAAATYLKSIAEAIQFAHDRNILHRDLKPSNVLVDSATNQPRLTDFGLAKRLESESELTLSGQVLGSPNYMPPEQIAGKRDTVGKRSDIYSLGAILYHCLTGRPPFQGDTLADVLNGVTNTDPLAPRLLIPSIPRDLETSCLKCLEKEPSRRYQTAQELADDLGRFLRDEPIQAHPVTPMERGWRWCRRNPVLAGLASSLALVFALGFGATLWQWRHAVLYARIAEQNAELAKENRSNLDQNLYDIDMNLAQRTWDEGNLGGALGLLEAHRTEAGDKKDRRGFEWFYFRNLCDGDPHVTLKGHNQAVTCVAFSPDGKHLATGSRGDPVIVWDTATGEIVRRLPEEIVSSLAFAPDGQSLGVGGQDRVVVWDLQTGKAIFKHEERLGRFRIAFAPQGKLLITGEKLNLWQFAQDGGSAKLWDYATGELKHEFPKSGGHIALSPKEEFLATGNWDKSIKIWRLSDFHLMRTIEGGVVTMTFAPKGLTLAASYQNREIKLWDVENGQEKLWLNNKENGAESLAFSPDGRSLATTDGEQILFLWEVSTGRLIEEFRGHAKEVTSIDFSPDGQTIATGSKDKMAMLWGVHPARAMTTLSNVVSGPIFSPDGELVAAGIRGNQVAAWETATLKLKATFNDAAEAVAFSSDGKALITRGNTYFLRTFDVATHAAQTTTSRGPVYNGDSVCALSPDGRVLAVGWTNGTLEFCNAKTGDVISSSPDTFAENIFQLAYSPNGNYLAAAGREIRAGRPPTAKVWDAETHKPLAVLAGHTEVVLAIAFSPDSKILATGGADHWVRFWDTASWKEIPGIEQNGLVDAVAFAPSGRVIAAASYSGTMKLWNVATRRELASLNLNQGGGPIAFSPNGQTLMASGRWDGMLRLWRAPGLPEMRQIPGSKHSQNSSP